MKPIINFRKHKRWLLIVALAIALLLLYVLYDTAQCDLIEQGKMVQTPRGKMIPLFSDLKQAKSFGELSPKCEYNGDNKITCPDVRHLGVSMNHQSQLVIGRIHAVLDLICRRHNIKYFLDFATLLGARRTGRMLAWDYDGDVGIMIDDYRTLLKYVRQDLPDDLYFQDGSDNPSYKRRTDAKIRDRNSCYTTCLRTKCAWQDGLQVDIFVYRRKNKLSDTIVNFFDKAYYDINDVLPIKNIKFEGLVLQGPHNVDGVLQSNYGPDFMTPPSKTLGQCSKNGYLSIPWYSCEYIEDLPKDKKEQVLNMSEDHRGLWYRFHL